MHSDEEADFWVMLCGSRERAMKDHVPCSNCGAPTTGYLDLRDHTKVVCIGCAWDIVDVIRLSRLIQH